MDGIRELEPVSEILLLIRELRDHAGKDRQEQKDDDDAEADHAELVVQQAAEHVAGLCVSAGRVFQTLDLLFAAARKHGDHHHGTAFPGTFAFLTRFFPDSYCALILGSMNAYAISTIRFMPQMHSDRSRTVPLMMG